MERSAGGRRWVRMGSDQGRGAVVGCGWRRSCGLGKRKEKERKRKERERKDGEGEKEKTQGSEDLFAKQRKGRRVAARRQEWERKKAMGKP